MEQKILQDKCRGSLVGGAIGDALGYGAEFMSLADILKKYGESGIENYEIDSNGIAEISDDTQMSLFTAEGLLNAIEEDRKDIEDFAPYFTTAYTYWYDTQIPPPIPREGSWMSQHIELWDRRAPGVTCMEACDNIWNGLEVMNDSKGCGGIIRVAPIGIFSAAHPKVLDIEHAGCLAGYAAEITHKHRISTYSSMALAMIVSECISHENIDRNILKSIIIDRVFKPLGLRFKGDNHLAYLFDLVLKAMWFATAKESDTDAIRKLGQGWVAEETLAIGIFSAMRYTDDFESCICCAVNHDGDSDSTGSVAGYIIGAILGYSAIPEKYLTNLELHDVLVSVADDLGGFSSEIQMKRRYGTLKIFNRSRPYVL